MGDSFIEWTEKTWNPTRGCLRVSEGCRHCYAEQQAARTNRQAAACGRPGPYDGLVKIINKEARWTGDARVVLEHLTDPLGWRTPKLVFVNSMSDLFYERFSNEEIAAIFGVMAACPHHTFQILTKRAVRMREWFEWAAKLSPDPANVCIGTAESTALDEKGHITARIAGAYGHVPWPLPNVWLGVSVEHQDAADERVPELLETPAAVRFLSCEPLLSQVDLSDYFDPCSVPCGEDPWPLLDLVIAGCESGDRRRPCAPDWFRILRDQCARAGVDFFLKQAVEDKGFSRSGAPVLVAGRGSKRKRRQIIGLPYLDGVQHAALPSRIPT